jgi:hypothetical protein
VLAVFPIFYFKERIKDRKKHNLKISYIENFVAATNQEMQIKKYLRVLAAI